MNDSGRDHFAADQDTLERYVLGKMDDAERTSVEAHMAACDACRRAVEEERRVASAVRFHARSSLKRRLSQRVGTPRPQLPWPHIIAAAAVVFIVAGIGLAAGWLELFIQRPAAGHRDTVVTSMAHELPPPGERDADRSTTEEKVLEAPPPVLSPARSASSSVRQEAATPPGEARKQTHDAEVPSPSAPTPHMHHDETLLFGSVTRTGDDRHRPEKIGTPDRTFKTEARKEASEAEGGRPSTMTIQAGQQVRVLLRSQASLSTVRPDAFRDSAQVPTLVAQSGDTLLLMPFLTDLRDSASLSVEQPTVDSIILHLPGRMISYKVPSQYQQRNPRSRQLRTR